MAPLERDPSRGNQRLLVALTRKTSGDDLSYCCRELKFYTPRVLETVKELKELAGKQHIPCAISVELVAYLLIPLPFSGLEAVCVKMS